MLQSKPQTTFGHGLKALRRVASIAVHSKQTERRTVSVAFHKGLHHRHVVRSEGRTRWVKEKRMITQGTAVASAGRRSGCEL